MKTYCNKRKDLKRFALPYGNEGKYTLQERFQYRWTDDDTFEVLIDGKWEEASSMDFDF